MSKYRVFQKLWHQRSGLLLSRWWSGEDNSSWHELHFSLIRGIVIWYLPRFTASAAESLTRFRIVYWRPSSFNPQSRLPDHLAESTGRDCIDQTESLAYSWWAFFRVRDLSYYSYCNNNYLLWKYVGLLVWWTYISSLSVLRLVIAVHRLLMCTSCSPLALRFSCFSVRGFALSASVCFRSTPDSIF